MTERLFRLGQLVCTPQAIAILRERDPGDDHNAEAARLLARHHAGDWGHGSEKGNNQALKQDRNLLSKYGEGEDEIWIMTNGDRTHTRIMVPSEMYDGTKHD